MKASEVIFLKLQYKMKKITAEEIWAMVEVEKLTAAQAESICGKQKTE